MYMYVCQTQSSIHNVQITSHMYMYTHMYTCHMRRWISYSALQQYLHDDPLLPLGGYVLLSLR